MKKLYHIYNKYSKKALIFFNNCHLPLILFNLIPLLFSILSASFLQDSEK